MENLFPIRYWINLPMKTNFLSMSVSSSTIPFRFNNEWYTITQEDSKFVSTMRIYTINKLPAIHPPMFPSTISSTAININEIEEVTKFMMNAAIEEYQKRKAQQFVFGFPNLSIEPIFVNDSTNKWKSSYEDRSTSTSDLMKKHEKSRVSFSQTSFNGTAKHERHSLSHQQSPFYLRFDESLA